MIKNNALKWAQLDMFTECYTQWASMGSLRMEQDHSKVLRSRMGTVNGISYLNQIWRHGVYSSLPADLLYELCINKLC